MRIAYIKVYSFDELSKEAKENAISNTREITDTWAWEKENTKTLQAFEDVFPVKVAEFEYDAGCYVHFIFKEKDTIENLSGQRLATYLWNNYKDRLYKGKFYSIGHNDEETGKYTYKSRHSKIILDNCCPLTGYCADDDILEPIFSFMKKPDDRDFYALMNDCLMNWAKCCFDEYEYLMSDEGIIEAIKANGEEFTEDGEFFSVNENTGQVMRHR